MDDEVVLGDGRRAQLWLGGADEGPLVLFFHGCPDTRHIAMTGHRAAMEVGVRLLCVNRPGYGRSDAHASTQGSVADDAVAVARSLGHERFAVLGMSVGCSYAVACAARYPDRARALGLAAPQRPVPTPGTVEEKVTEYRPGFLEYVARLRPDDPDDEALARRYLTQLDPGDAALFDHTPASEVAAAAREALAVLDGYLRDAALLHSPWDHRPEEVACPIHSWFGALDQRSPVVQLGDVVVRPSTTHLATLVAHWPDVLTTLRAHLGD